ncbi:unnamed protein product, partial [Didymodactylos carnosus]
RQFQTTTEQTITVMEFKQDTNNDEEKALEKCERPIKFSNKEKKVSKTCETICKYLIIICSIIIVTGIIIIHSCIPVIERQYYHYNTTEPNNTIDRPSYVQSIEYSYLFVGLIVYGLFIIIMAYSIFKFNYLNEKLTSIMLSATNDERYIEILNHKY